MTTTTSFDQTTAIKKPRKWMGMDPAPDAGSWSDVPWYRKSDYALFPLMLPAIFVIMFTGDVYYRATDRMKEYADADVWRFTRSSKLLFAILDTIVVLSFALLLVS